MSVAARKAEPARRVPEAYCPGLERVAEFHQTFGVSTPSHPTFMDDKTAMVRSQLITEELAEFQKAYNARDMGNALKELADLSYVVDGTWLCMGLGAYKTTATDLVHQSNMSKLGPDGRPIISPAGRIVKGPGYWEPDMVALLKELRDNPDLLTYARLLASRGIRATA